MNNIYIYIVLGHKSFFSGKICIVKLSSTQSFTYEYAPLAKQKACKSLKLNPQEVSILDWKYLGEDVHIIS